MSWASELEAGGAFRRQRREDSSDCSARNTASPAGIGAPRCRKARSDTGLGPAVQPLPPTLLAWRHERARRHLPEPSCRTRWQAALAWAARHGPLACTRAKQPASQAAGTPPPLNFSGTGPAKGIGHAPPPRRKSFSRRRGTPPASRSQLRLARDWPAVTLQENRPLLFRNHCKLVVRSNASPSSHGVWQHRMSSPRTCPQHHGPATRSGPTQAVTSRQGSTHTTLRPTVSSSVVCRSCGTNLRPAPSGLC